MTEVFHCGINTFNVAKPQAPYNLLFLYQILESCIDFKSLSDSDLNEWKITDLTSGYRINFDKRICVTEHDDLNPYNVEIDRRGGYAALADRIEEKKRQKSYRKHAICDAILTEWPLSFETTVRGSFISKYCSTKNEQTMRKGIKLHGIVFSDYYSFVEYLYREGWRLTSEKCRNDARKGDSSIKLSPCAAKYLLHLNTSSVWNEPGNFVIDILNKEKDLSKEEKLEILKLVEEDVEYSSDNDMLFPEDARYRNYRKMSYCYALHFINFTMQMLNGEKPGHSIVNPYDELGGK